jgi:hypothetical protein
VRCPSCQAEMHQVFERIERCAKGHTWDVHGNIQTREYGWIPELAREVDRLRAELAATKAESPRPAAIVQVIGGHFHGFESDTDALAFRNERDDVGISQHSVCYSWTWHARAAEGEAK